MGKAKKAWAERTEKIEGDVLDLSKSLDGSTASELSLLAQSQQRQLEQMTRSVSIYESCQEKLGGKALAEMDEKAATSLANCYFSLFVGEKDE